jgi:prepilin-type N-terminal cleavage/methylation domain-containing protein
MRSSCKTGFTLLETMISMSVLLIIVTATYSLILGLLNFTASSKARDIATSLVGNRLETIRNMPFSEVKTDQGWYPPGTIPSTENIFRNGVNFILDTDIIFVDCPYEADCQDMLYQYKRITVTVSWDKYPGKPVSISTDITPRNGEALNPDVGYFWIKVFNASGQGIETATVNINNTTNAYTLSATTNKQGFLYVTDVPPLTGYKVSVSKNNMSTDQTYSNQDLINLGYANAVVDPSKADLNALAGKLIESSFAIDFMANINVSTVNAHISSPNKINQTANNLEEITHVTESNGTSYFLMKTGTEPQRVFLQKVDTNMNVIFGTDLDVSGSNNNFHPSLMEDGAYVYIVLARGALNNAEIYVQKVAKSDGAKLFGNGIKLTDNGKIENQYPMLVSNEDNKLIAVWLETVSGSQVFKWMRMDQDDGDKDYASAQTITGTFAMPSAPSYDICVLKSTSKIVLTWTDNSNGNLDVFAQIFDKDFSSISAKFLVHEANTNDQSQPSVFCKEDSLTFSWSGGSPDNTKIRLSRFDWTPNRIDPFLTDIALASIQDYSQTDSDIIVTPTNEVYGVWLDNRNGNNEVYAQKLASDNTKTFATDFKVSTSANQFTKYSPTVSYLAPLTMALGSYMDSSAGTSNLYASKIPSSDNTNSIGNVAITFTGSKKLGTYGASSKPIYKNIHTFRTNAAGNFSISNIEWDSYGVLPESPYTIIDSYPTLPFSALPTITTNLNLNLQP